MARIVTITMEEAEERIDKYCYDMEAGLIDEAIITENGKPYLRMIPYEDKSKCDGE